MKDGKWNIDRKINMFLGTVRENRLDIPIQGYTNNFYGIYSNVWPIKIFLATLYSAQRRENTLLISIKNLDLYVN